MPEYNVIAELDFASNLKNAARVLTKFDPARYRTAVGRSPDGRSELILTLDAPTMTAAAAEGLHVIQRALGNEPLSYTVMTTAEYDDRVDAMQDNWSSLMSTVEVAELLHVSRQRVQQLHAQGVLTGRPFGRTLAFDADVVRAYAREHRQRVVDA